MTSLYYYGARYYDPEIGRFISRDPNPSDPKNPQSSNRYLYCLCNPLKYIDPFGLEESESNPLDMTEEELREYVKSMFGGGLSLGEILDFIGELISDFMEAEGLLDMMESLIDFEINVIMEVLEPVLNVLAVVAEVANEYVENFEGMVVEISVQGGALLGGTAGISLVYSTTEAARVGSLKAGWKGFKFFGAGSCTPGASVQMGIGAFCWYGKKDFEWKRWEGLFIEFSGTAGPGIASIGGQVFASGNGNIIGAMVLIGAGFTPGGQASSYLCYYWPHGEKFSWLKFLRVFSP